MTTGISNGRLGMMLLVGTETILFSSFIGAYLVLRLAAAAWPPMGTPHLTPGLSSANTVLLLLSSVVIWQGHPSPHPSPKGEGGRRPGEGSMYLLVVLAMGVLFLVLQGVEFHRLYARGLTLQTGTYGALFYALVTCHGLHVLGGLGILAVALRKAAWAEYAELYWHFVTGVWLVLFAVLYLV